MTSADPFEWKREARIRPPARGCALWVPETPSQALTTGDRRPSWCPGASHPLPTPQRHGLSRRAVGPLQGARVIVLRHQPNRPTHPRRRPDTIPIQQSQLVDEELNRRPRSTSLLQRSTTLLRLPHPAPPPPTRINAGPGTSGGVEQCTLCVARFRSLRVVDIAGSCLLVSCAASPIVAGPGQRADARVDAENTAQGHGRFTTVRP